MIKSFLNLRVQSIISEWRSFTKGGDDVLFYQLRFCVADVGELGQHILVENRIRRDILFTQVPLRCTAICGKSISGMA